MMMQTLFVWLCQDCLAGVPMSKRYPSDADDADAIAVCACGGSLCWCEMCARMAAVTVRISGGKEKADARAELLRARGLGGGLR